jgi:hypothetical protein
MLLNCWLCFHEQQILHSLLSTSWFQERIRECFNKLVASKHNRTKIDLFKLKWSMKENIRNWYRSERAFISLIILTSMAVQSLSSVFSPLSFCSLMPFSTKKVLSNNLLHASFILYERIFCQQLWIKRCIRMILEILLKWYIRVPYNILISILSFLIAINAIIV